MTTEWFDGTRFLAMAFGLVLAMSRLGDFLAVSVGPIIADTFQDYRATLWVGAIFTGASFVFTVVYGVADKWTTRKYPKKPRSPEKINFFSILRFDARFWLISFITMMYYGGVTPFLANAKCAVVLRLFSVCFMLTSSPFLFPLSDFLQVKYNFTPSNAGLTSSVIILASMVLSPVLGKVVDSFGYRPYFVVFGGLAILPAHLLLGLSYFTPFFGIVVIGLSFSLVPSALWPSIPLIVDEDSIRTSPSVLSFSFFFWLSP
jgi:MFS family permease